MVNLQFQRDELANIKKIMDLNYFRRKALIQFLFKMIHLKSINHPVTIKVDEEFIEFVFDEEEGMVLNVVFDIHTTDEQIRNHFEKELEYYEDNYASLEARKRKILGSIAKCGNHRRLRKANLGAQSFCAFCGHTLPFQTLS